VSDDRRDFELLESREVFRGRVLDVRVDRVRLANGRDSELEVVRHPGAVAVVPVTDDGHVLLVRQYRYATREWVLEVPAGKLDHPGEAPAACAARELEEETGYRARTLDELGWVWTTPGFSDEKIWLFLARGLEPSRQDLQADEVLTVQPMPFEQAIERALDGSIQDAKSVCSLLRAANRLGRSPVAR
jgi:ADP-ribose pyrophosphatase